MAQMANKEPNPADTMWGFAIVWLISSAATILMAWLAVTGRLWNVGFPGWLIAFSVLVGIWQWIWVVPVLSRAKRRERRGFYSGLLAGAVSFSLLNITACVILFFKLRHVSLQ